MPTHALPAESSTSSRQFAPEGLNEVLALVAEAIRGQRRAAAAAELGALRSFVESRVSRRVSGPAQPGALPELLGAAATLQYPLMQLELFLGGERSDIGGAAQAESYLSFVRYHLWKLEPLLREPPVA